MIEQEWIRNKVGNGQYYFSRHGDQERQNDNLTVAEVETALLTGAVIEQYEDTGRGESSLVAGFTKAGVPVHAVCGTRGDWLVIVTTYVPKAPKFKNPYERGRL